MALWYQCIEMCATLAHANLSEEAIWRLIFYFYQCSQFFLINATYFLCYRFARNVGIRSMPALALVTALFSFNTPLLRTLRHNQINLWVLDLILLAILFSRAHPIISGLVVAPGGHIKVYPLALWLPWSITRRWRAIVGSLVGFFSIVFIQTSGGRNWRLWYQFLAFSRSFPRGTRFRDNSLHSIVYNLVRMAGLLVDGSTARLQAITDVVVALITFVIVVWFAVRFIERERIFSALTKVADRQSSNLWEDTSRLYGHLLDAVTLALLISPQVWEHHYVLAMPMILWAAATRWRDRPWPVGIGAFLILVLPTFDVFPFSYHRLAGLLMLLCLTSPKALGNARIGAKQAGIPVSIG